MKYLLLFVSTLLFIGAATAQTPLKEREFIRQIIIDPNIIYNSKANGYAAASMRDVVTHNKTMTFYRVNADSVIYTDSTGVQKRMLHSEAMPLVLTLRRARMMQIYVDSIKLTNQEYNLILEKLDSSSQHRWEKDLLTNGKQIEADTVAAVFNDLKRGWEYMYKHGINSIHSFSLPVFIRNDTYCVFYSDNSCGNLCGGGRLNIYKKENGKWVYWGNITRWIS